MVAWLQQFITFCVRVGRNFVAAVECELRVVLRDRFGIMRVVHTSPPPRQTDSRPRLRVALTCREGPPEGLVRLLCSLEAREPGQIDGLRHALAEAGVLVPAAEAKAIRGNE
jgi:hypothetical protein